MAQSLYRQQVEIYSRKFVICPKLVNMITLTDVLVEINNVDHDDENGKYLSFLKRQAYQADERLKRG